MARSFGASAILMNPGDQARASVQGSDTAGFWVDDSAQTRILGMPVVTTTTALASKSPIIGDFRVATLFVGED